MIKKPVSLKVNEEMISGVIAFDFSGHGESSGQLKQGSLEKRVHEAKAMIDQFGAKELYIIENCPHNITTWILGQEFEQKKLHQKILKYIK